MSDNGWTPTLSHDGLVFCSPRCGCRCKKVDYDHAVEAGDALAKTMGDGWRSEVWENGGWHYRAIKGVAAIHPNLNRLKARDDGKYPVINYTCFFNSDHQFVCSADDPCDALGFATQSARTLIAAVDGDLRAMFGDSRP